MGWQASKAVWEQSKMNGNAKLLMLALAEHMGESGVAWPSIARLADMLGIGERAIKRLISDCEAAGELAVDRATGRGNTNEYRFLFEQKGDETITDCGLKGDRAITVYEEVKGDPSDIKGDPFGKKGDPSDIKGDRTITLKHKEPIEPKEKEISTNAGALEKTPKIPKSAPYAVYERLLEIEPGMKKGQSLREIKVMLDNGSFEPEDILACGAFLQTDPWRLDNMIPLTTRAIQEKLPKWLSVGRPSTWQEFKAHRPGVNGHTPPEPSRSYFGSGGIGVKLQ